MTFYKFDYKFSQVVEEMRFLSKEQLGHIIGHTQLVPVLQGGYGVWCDFMVWLHGFQLYSRIRGGVGLAWPVSISTSQYGISWDQHGWCPGFQWDMGRWGQHDCGGLAWLMSSCTCGNRVVWVFSYFPIQYIKCQHGWPTCKIL